MTTCRAIEHHPTQPDWSAHIDALWADLGAPDNPDLFPDYFIKTTFPRLGGRLFRLTDAAGVLQGAALLFPRTIVNGVRYVTLRLHAPTVDAAEASAAIAPQIAPDQAVVYRPAEGRTFAASGTSYGAYSIGAPSHAELAAISALQRTVWGAETGHGYPSDLHSAEFAPGSSLVARLHDQVVGFLFGFTRFTPPTGLPGVSGEVYLESQLLAIDPAHRGGGLAAALKRAQAQAALESGVRVVHWTADPLQWANAGLNFGALGAIAGTLYPGYYPFTNALNRVTASRLGIVWLPGSAHGGTGLRSAAPAKRTCRDIPGLAILNDGSEIIAEANGAPAIGVEVPVNWTALQHEALECATAWRATTDLLLGAHLGFTPGRYVITGVAREGERRYLIAQAFTPELLA